jgi:hypothetical protein
MPLKTAGEWGSMSNTLRRWLCGAIAGTLTGVSVIGSVASAQQAKLPSQVRVNDFPSVKGYDPGYAIPYDPADPWVALDYINEQFDGVWTDIDGGSITGLRYFSRAPEEEDYTDLNRQNPTPNTPILTPGAAAVYRKIHPMILAGNNPAQAVGWCFISHQPTTTAWNQFAFTPDSMNVSTPGGGGSIHAHIYMDGRPHPANLKPSETGHMVAHWEGAWLVIDGVGYTADRDLEIGLLNSDQQHVVARYRRLPPDILEVEYTLTDSKVLAQPWIVKRRWRRNSMEVNMLRDVHCNLNANLPDESGGNNFVGADGKKLQKVPTR